MEFNFFGKRISIGNNEPIQEDIQENTQDPNTPQIIERAIFDSANSEMLGQSEVIGITESVMYTSPADLKKMIDSNDIKLGSLLDALKAEYSSVETFRENEEMAKDTIIGSAMEMMADDCCMVEPAYKKIVTIQSEDLKLAEFLNTFLEKNVNIENRIWEWALEVVKHGDFKLRRMEYEVSRGTKSVYYENVIEGYKVSRIEYLGTVLGYLDEEDGRNVLESKEAFVHFLSSKLPNRKKIKVKVKTKDDKPLDVAGQPNTKTPTPAKAPTKAPISAVSPKKAGDPDVQYAKEINCFKVSGTSLVDNARYIYRIVNLLDNMLIMSRVARSTQYNIVKIEVGNASPSKTQEMIMDVRRRIEGSTKMTKGKGMRTDPSPIPVNSNIYIPVREGKGDINIESVNDSVDVKSIVDIDYFRNKEFATIRTPKAYMGFEETLPGSMGNTSLVKLDIRYARNVQRGQTIVKAGVKDLCNNYLRYRGRPNDVDNFDVCMRSVTSAEDSSRIEDFMGHIAVFDSMTTLLTEFGEFIEKPRIMNYLLTMMGINVADIASPKMQKILKAIERGEELPTFEEEEPPADGEDVVPPDEEAEPTQTPNKFTR